MAQPLVQPHFHAPFMHQEPPANISLRVSNQLQLDFVYYSIAKEGVFDETEIFYEYTMEEGADGDFMITLPRPPGPLQQWLVSVHGFRYRDDEPEEVFKQECNAKHVF